MTLILKLLQYNDIFATSIAIVGNILLIYLILTVKKNNIKKMNIILLPNCIIDLLTAIVILISQPLTVVIDKRAFMIMGSGFTSKYFNFASILMWLFGSFLALTMNGVCIPFYIRYLIICKNVKIGAKHIILPYLILFISFILIFCIYVWCYPINLEYYVQYKGALNNEFWLDEYKNGPAFVTADIDEIPFLSVLGFFLFTSGCSYGIVIYCSIKVVKTLHAHASNSSLTKILSKQLHKTLTIQAIGPLLISNIPVTILIVIFYFKIENLTFALFFTFFFGWISVVNPIAAILIISPYRQKVKKLITFNRTSTTTIGTTHPFQINAAKETRVNITQTQISLLES